MIAAMVVGFVVALLVSTLAFRDGWRRGYRAREGGAWDPNRDVRVIIDTSVAGDIEIDVVVDGHAVHRQVWSDDDAWPVWSSWRARCQRAALVRGGRRTEPPGAA